MLRQQNVTLVAGAGCGTWCRAGNADCANGAASIGVENRASGMENENANG